MNRIYYVKRHHTPSRNKLAVIPLFFLVFLLIIISIALFYFIRPQKKEVIATDVPVPTPTVTLVPTVYDNRLKQSVENSLRGTKGSYGVVVKNLDTNESYSFNEHVVYNAASLYKLWVMAVVFRQIEDGKLKEDTPLSEDVAVLNKKFRIASEAAELTEGRVSSTVENALFKMITVSDNYSALLLTQKVKLPTITSYLSENGFLETKMGTTIAVPTTTAYDVALFFEKLHGGNLGSKENTEKMLSLLKQQKLNSKIPRLLPEGVTVAHKTGELDNYTHDAGLILDKKGNYLIVVLSKSEQPNLAATRIADIANSVYSKYISKN